MRMIVDTGARTLTTVRGDAETTMALDSREAFETLSLEWVRLGWSLRYYHNFSWGGLPILQLPEDLVRLQEVIYRVRPDVIVETGIYCGGSLLFHATLCEAMGQGRVIGVDVRVEESVRERVAGHYLGRRIVMVEGDSTAPEVVARVAEMIRPGETVLVILDSGHTREHVARELECYAPLVTRGSYIVATDGIMRDLWDVPRGEAAWAEDNPLTAANAFAARHPEFRQAQPAWPFQEGEIVANVTYWPGAWLERIGGGAASVTLVNDVD